jgi:hypothetical protein
MFEPFYYASNSLGTQADCRQGRNFFGTHSLPKVEPEDHTVALLLRPAEAMLQMFIDLTQKDLRRDFVLAPMNLLAGLGFDVNGGNMWIVATG